MTDRPIDDASSDDASADDAPFDDASFDDAGFADTESDRLPCGRSASQVWDDAAGSEASNGLDEHERDCPYCTAVAQSRWALDPAAADLLGRPPQPPSRLLDAVMRSVRAELRPGARLPMPTDVGSAFVVDHVVARAVLSLLDADPAVIARRCRVSGPPDGAGWLVELTLAVSYDYFSRRGEDELRTRVRDAVHTWFGAPLAGVDIDIVDVFAARPSVRPRS